MERRDFIQYSAWGSLGLSLGKGAWSPSVDIHLPDGVEDEIGWQQYGRCWPRPGDALNMNHATRGQPTRSAIKAYERSVRHALDKMAIGVHTSPELNQDIRQRISTITGLDADALALVHNGTQAMSTIINGIALQAGDEVIIGRYDYPTMQQAWHLRALRERIVVVEVDVTKVSTTEEVIGLYRDHVTDRTRAIHVTDVVHSWGGRLPTKQIIDAMPDHVIFRIVDAAQRLGHTDDRMAHLGATHIGASLHKWLMSPGAVGMLYVHPDHIRDTYPLHGAPDRLSQEIGKYEILGTLDYWTLAATLVAMADYQTLDSALVHDRLLYLTDQLRMAIQNMDHLELLSPTNPSLRTAIATIRHRSMDRKQLHRALAARSIHGGLMNHDEIRGVRLSPGLSTSMKMVDMVIEALRDLS